MGMLISGKWNKQKIKSRDGRFGQRQSQFRDKLTADGSSRFNTKGGPCRLYIDAILALALALMVSCAAIASAQEAHSYSRASFGQWLANNADAKPNFKPGDVLKRPRMRAPLHGAGVLRPAFASRQTTFQLRCLTIVRLKRVFVFG